MPDVSVVTRSVRFYVVVSGPPGSGKTTVARELARTLGFPLFSKDTIKEAIMADIEVTDVETSKRIGRTAIAALLAVAIDSGFGVIDSAWRRSVSMPGLMKLPAPVVEVFCRCDRDLARSRYEQRSAQRAAGHFDQQRLADDELWTGEAAEPVGGGWALLEVDTSGVFDLDQVVSQVLSASGEPRRIPG